MGVIISYSVVTRGGASVQGNPEVASLTIEESQSLAIAAGNTLTVETLNQEGTIDIYGTLNVTTTYNKGTEGKLFKREGGTITGVLKETDINDLSEIPKRTITAEAYKDILIEADGYTTTGKDKIPYNGTISSLLKLVQKNHL